VPDAVEQFDDGVGPRRTKKKSKNKQIMRGEKICCLK